MKKMWCILLMGLLACISQAAVVEYDLDCAGMYYESNPTWSTNFDLNEQFSSITSVSIIWSGGFGAALVTNPNTPGEDWKDVTLYVDYGDYLGSSRYASVSGGTENPPEEELFNCQTYISGNWDDLLDGTGSLTIGHFFDFLSVPNITVVSTGTIVLNNATLVVEGTLVPEPVSLTLLLTAGAFTIRRR